MRHVAAVRSRGGGRSEAASVPSPRPGGAMAADAMDLKGSRPRPCGSGSCDATGLGGRRALRGRRDRACETPSRGGEDSQRQDTLRQPVRVGLGWRSSGDPAMQAPGSSTGSLVGLASHEHDAFARGVDLAPDDEDGTIGSNGNGRVELIGSRSRRTGPAR